MTGADMVELTIKEGQMVVTGADIVGLRNRLTAYAEKEEKKLMDIREIIDIATQAQEAQTKLECVKKVLTSRGHNYTSYTDLERAIATILGVILVEEEK